MIVSFSQIPWKVVDVIVSTLRKRCSQWNNAISADEMSSQARRQTAFGSLQFEINKCARRGGLEKCSRGKSGFGNKPIVENHSGSVVIAIFAEHSTRLESRTIILTSRDRAVLRARWFRRM
jgi:hypothetical protein